MIEGRTRTLAGISGARSAHGRHHPRRAAGVLPVAADDARGGDHSGRGGARSGALPAASGRRRPVPRGRGGRGRARASCSAIATTSSRHSAPRRAGVPARPAQLPRRRRGIPARRARRRARRSAEHRQRAPRRSAHRAVHADDDPAAHVVLRLRLLDARRSIAWKCARRSITPSTATASTSASSPASASSRSRCCRPDSSATTRTCAASSTIRNARVR